MSIISKSIPTFRRRVMQSGYWTLTGYGVSQVLRLGGNLILTRLLFPEAFGMMAIIQAVIYGVHMLTDVGIGASIVQKDNGNDPVFLNTAWTVQIVRGFLACLVLLALAAPVANFYEEPLLANMLRVVALSAIIGGFFSTKLCTAQRNLEAGRLTLIEVGTYAFGLLSTIFLAWWLRSVWALVWGSFIADFIKMIVSHVGLHGIKNRLTWNRAALDQLLRFGRWILLSSALTFMSVEGSRLFIGAVLDMRQLALFTLASTMSLLFWQAMQQVASRVFFPAYSEVHRTNPENLISVLYKVRLIFILPNWGLGVLFVFFGTWVMELLYDERYHESGVMLQQLGAGTLVACLWGSYSGVLLARGKVAAMTTLTAIQIICQFSMMVIGHRYGGSAGLIMGVAAANWLVYPAYAWVMSRNGLWQPKLDMPFLGISVLIVAWAWSRLVPVSAGL